MTPDQLIAKSRESFPQADVGALPLSQLVARPSLLRLLPSAIRVEIDRRTMRASVAGWLRSRIEGVELTSSRLVAKAEPTLTPESRILWREAKELNLIFGAIWRK